MTLTRRILAMMAAAVVVVSGLTAIATITATQAAAQTMRPIIFMHGFFGSGTQFQTQAKRFASNGYPATYMESHDYDSLFTTETREQVFTRLDARIARLKAATGADKVELMGHSLGTSMAQQYLSTAARAANIAHYVNIDGAGATSLPGGVPTLNITGEGNTSTITGGTQLRLSTQSHVQTTSSTEAFTGMYRFFRGTAPATTSVAAQAGTIQLAGRAVAFPSNVGVANATLNVYTVNAATGQRSSSTPVYTKALTGDGSFGPFDASGTTTYEFAVVRSGNNTHHYYQSPFRRTDLNIRLLGSDPGTGVDVLLERDARHVTFLNYRDKEWWADQTGSNQDTLTVNGTSILNSSTAPKSRRAIGVFAFDQGKNQQSNVTSVPGLLGLLPFMSGSDIYVPASPTASGTVTVVSRQRGTGLVGVTETIRFPNWPSNNNMVSVRYQDFS